MFTKRKSGILGLLLVAASASAYDFVAGDLAYSYVSQEDKTVEVSPMNYYESGFVPADNYSGLVNCVIPPQVTYNNLTYTVSGIAANAFNNAANLVSLSIPATVTEIGAVQPYGEASPLYNTNKLSTIVVDEKNPNYVSVDNVLFSKDKKTLLKYPTTKTGTSYTIPKGVEKIGASAFQSCAFVEVVLPSTLKTLCMAAFVNCNNLREIICYAVEPPTESTYWGFAHTGEETLYVPAEAVETYKSNSLWGNFKEILPIEESEVVLDENDANVGNQIAALGTRTDNVQLVRTFAADGGWYTLCLPFGLNEEQIAEGFGVCELMKLSHSTRPSEDVLNIHFVSTATVEAGVPYLFRPSVEVKDPTFTGVTFDASASTELAPADGLAAMTGNYAPAQVPAGKWYLGPDNTLYQPDGTLLSKGFRAYFSLASNISNKVRARVVMNGQVTTGVDGTADDVTSAAPRKVVKDGEIRVLYNGHEYNVLGQIID